MSTDVDRTVVAPNDAECVHAYIRGKWYGIHCAATLSLDDVANLLINGSVEGLVFFHTASESLAIETISNRLGLRPDDDLPGSFLLVEGRGPAAPAPDVVFHMLVGGLHETRVPIVAEPHELTVGERSVFECLYRLDGDLTSVRQARLLIGSVYPGLVALYQVGGENGPSPKI
jgi:hypothetical protein